MSVWLMNQARSTNLGGLWCAYHTTCGGFIDSDNWLGLLMTCLLYARVQRKTPSMMGGNHQLLFISSKRRKNDLDFCSRSEL
jgi:hypothetical protein